MSFFPSWERKDSKAMFILNLTLPHGVIMICLSLPDFENEGHGLYISCRAYVNASIHTLGMNLLK